MLTQTDACVREGVPYVKICGVLDFDIRKIFDCGQCFRFEPVEDTEHEAEFSGIAYGRFISVAQDRNDIYIYNCTADELEKIWKRYLALDEDYEKIKKSILSVSDNPQLKRAVEYGNGIRILRQEPWEAVCSFIVSQNNNIPRIKKIIEKIAYTCGETVDIPRGMEKKLSASQAPFAFPTPSALKELGTDGIFDLKTGFRAKYIYDAAIRFSNREIDEKLLLESKSTAECVEHLCGIKGVGPKVASCALLFGYGRYDAFPVDVWIKKVIEKYFSLSPERFLPSSLGEYAGIAQQYLFYYERYISSKTE